MLRHFLHPPVMTLFERFLQMDENRRALFAMDLLFDTKATSEDLRVAWELTYQHKPDYIIPIIKYQVDEKMVEAMVMAWLKRASFEVSLKGDVVVLYRGEARVVDHSPFGLSWTLEKDVAAFFAVTPRHVEEPTIYRAEIPIHKVLWHSNDRNENEVIFDLDWGRKAATIETIGTRQDLEDWSASYIKRKNG